MEPFLCKDKMLKVSKQSLARLCARSDLELCNYSVDSSVWSEGCFDRTHMQMEDYESLRNQDSHAAWSNNRSEHWNDSQKSNFSFQNYRMTGHTSTDQICPASNLICDEYHSTLMPHFDVHKKLTGCQNKPFRKFWTVCLCTQWLPEVQPMQHFFAIKLRFASFLFSVSESKGRFSRMWYSVRASWLSRGKDIFHGQTIGHLEERAKQFGSVLEALLRRLFSKS